MIAVMTSPAESAVMAYFFAKRANRRRRAIPGEDRLMAACMARARQEEAARLLEEDADRWAYEAGLD